MDSHIFQKNVCRYIKKEYEAYIMKDLEAYIKEIKAYKLPNVLGYRTFEEFMCLNGLTEDNLTEQDIEAYVEWNIGDMYERYERSYNRVVYETLISHKPEKLISKLEDEYGDKVYNIRHTNSSDNKQIFTFDIKENDYKDIVDTKKFDDILKFYNYIKIKDVHYKMSKKYTITLEANVTTNVTDYVYNECDGILYHITPVQYKDSILNTGLRTKVTKKYKIPKDFIEFHKRIYCIATTSKNLNKVFEEAKTMFDEDNEEYCVIKIDLSKIRDKYLENGMQFYKDVRSIYEYTVYTFTYIPKECLSLYKERI